MRTWILGLAVCTCVVPRDIVNEILKGLLVARLLALAEITVHVCDREGREVEAPLVTVGMTSIAAGSSGRSGRIGLG